MPSKTVIEDFMAQKRLAVVGVSRRPDAFGNAIYRELRAKGYTVYPVSQSVEAVDGDRCYPSVAELPEVDGVVVMVDREHAAAVVKDCVDAHVPRVWLHRGAGGAGAVSEEAVALCRQHGVAVVDGACPLMYAQPVGWIHRAHRFCQRLAGSLPT